MSRIMVKAALAIATIMLSQQALAYSLKEYYAHQAPVIRSGAATSNKPSPAQGYKTSDPQFLQCFQDVGKRYNVNANLLIAHAIKESHLDPSAINRQPNGEAVGLMQIHSQWFQRLERDYHITRRMLLAEPCLNVSVGAWIIANNFSSRGVSWDTVGAYFGGYADSKADERLWYYGGKGGVREIYRRLQQGEDPMLVAGRR
ncbi:transglycosylase SLT domain-containing protein (plasmid) [Aeromonas caviae]|uniref:Transglycosylase SLT domain-containing protein n=1 Tax=Aeromonas caviae TaxID=648 RepID=A0A7D5UKN4_AERCA|nr:transglycosylase SLT domain-containing protein [Aeromonas caviae]QLI60483.1 transglycosylase SLT domain-containing protein [Aeromonas caviae]